MTTMTYLHVQMRNTKNDNITVFYYEKKGFGPSLQGYKPLMTGQPSPIHSKAAHINDKDDTNKKMTKTTQTRKY